MAGLPLYGDRDDDDTAVVVRTTIGRTEPDQVGIGNLPVAAGSGDGAAVAEVGVLADEVAAVEIARTKEPNRVQIQCIRLDFPVGHCRRVLCRGKPAPRSRHL